MNLFSRLFPRRPPLDQAFGQCKTPAEVCAVVRRWVRPCETMDKDRPDLELVWRRGYGDCDDLARLVKFGCETSGICTTAQVWYFWPMNRTHSGHALVVGWYVFGHIAWYSSNGDYARQAAVRIEQIAARILGCEKVWSRKME